MRSASALDSLPPRSEIREARAGDATQIVRLIRVLGYHLDAEQVEGRLSEYAGRYGRVFVAIKDESVVGFVSVQAIASFHEASRLGRITAMAIEPGCQRQGLGRSLVQAAETFAIDVGCSRIEVTSGDHREQDAHLFYAAQGYAVDCRRFLKRL